MIFLLTFCACKTVWDPSIAALEAGDFTLVSSPCENTPGQGLDICRFTEGTQIQSSWRLAMPYKGGVYGGEITLYYRDAQPKSFAVTGPIVEIPWEAFFGRTLWRRASHDGQVLALANVNWRDDNGVERIFKARGLAVILVVKPGYSTLPIDSGVAQWKRTCALKIEYTTAGRSAFECK